MSLPTAYLTSLKNVKNILAAMQSAQAPPRFTTRFLESLGFKTPADRLIIGVLKAIGFLTPGGEPTKRYFEFLDQTQAPRVIAEGVREAYADLYQINLKAHELSQTEVRNKLKTLTQGQVSNSVIEKMAGTFKALASIADFSKPPSLESEFEIAEEAPEPTPPSVTALQPADSHPVGLNGLVYSIHLVLPESRDAAVFDVLFKSLKEHLLR